MVATETLPIKRESAMRSLLVFIAHILFGALLILPRTAGASVFQRIEDGGRERLFEVALDEVRLSIHRQHLGCNYIL